GVVRGVGGRVGSCRGARAGIAVPAGKVTRGDVQADPVAYPQHVADVPQLDPEQVWGARVEKGRVVVGLAEAAAHNAFGEVLDVTVGSDVGEHRDEVGVR